MYETGLGVPAEDAAALKYFLAGAQGNNADCMYRAAVFYQAGKGTAVNFNESLKWYNAASEAGSDLALNRLGEIYLAGTIVTQDTDHGATCFRKLQISGTSARWYTWRTCGTRAAVRRDAAQAARWYGMAADLKDHEAEYELGLLLEKGDGISRDPGAAADLYRKAANGGIAAAMDRLGMLLRDGGPGVQKNQTAAFDWFRKAAEAEYSNGMLNLGLMYAQGWPRGERSERGVQLVSQGRDFGQRGR